MADRYLDNTHGDALAGTLTFTITSTAVVGVGTNFLAEISPGDYIKPDTGDEWYKVSSVTNNTNLVLSWTYWTATIANDSSKVNDEDGSAIDQPYCHLTQALDDNDLGAGNTLFMRRNQTQYYGAYYLKCSLAGDGAVTGYAKIMGDDGTGWPAEVGNPVPNIDFQSRNNTFARFNMGGNVFLWFENMKVQNGPYTSAAGSIGRHGYIKNVEVTSCNRPLYFSSGTYDTVHYHGLTLWQIGATGTERVYAKDSVFDGPGSYVIYMDGGDLWLENCDLGLVDDAGTFLHWHDYGGHITARNCRWATEPTLTSSEPDKKLYASIHCEGDEQDKTISYSKYYNGEIRRDTTIVRPGGASSSVKMIPNTVASYFPVTFGAEPGDFGEPLLAYCPAGATTVTVYIRATAAWAGYPINTQLFITALYWNGATGARVESTHSVQVIADATTWVAFTTTFTPNAAGFVLVRVSLGDYEAGKSINVDPGVIVS